MFFTGLTILLNFIHSIPLSTAPLNATTLNVIPLRCISMSNQECKARLEIVNVNSNNPIFYPFSVKTTKCSGNCNGKLIIFTMTLSTYKNLMLDC